MILITLRIIFYKEKVMHSLRQEKYFKLSLF